MRNIRTEQANLIERTPEIMMFLTDARRYQQRNAEEQKELCRKAKAGDLKSKQELVNCNLLFMFSLCSKYAKGNDILDLISHTTIGLYNAIELYDESQGVNFLSYAVRAMQDEILQNLSSKEVVVNKYDYRLSGKVNKINEKFFQEHQRYPTNGEIVSILNDMGIDANEYQVLNFGFSSFSDIVGDDDATAEECGKIAVATATESASEQEHENEYVVKRLNICLSQLSEIESDIVKRFYGVGYEYPQQIEDIAREYRWSPERIRQIKDYALFKMQKVNKKLKTAI